MVLKGLYFQQHLFSRLSSIILLQCRSQQTHASGGGERPKTAHHIFDDEIRKFDNLADNWWDEFGEFKGLHSMNKLRVQLIRDGLINTHQIKPENMKGPQPLTGISILDVGCGGGILSEALARIGASVTGVDASAESIETAKSHASKDPRISNKIKYINSSIEDLVDQEPVYDAIVASEVLEHVDDKETCLKMCSQVLKPGGSFFITSINRTTFSWLAAIIVAEYVLSLLPAGTHSWDKFLAPEEALHILEKNCCRTVLIHGMMYNFLHNTWSWTSNTSVNYALHAVKHKTNPQNATDIKQEVKEHTDKTPEVKLRTQKVPETKDKSDPLQ